tara:strand:+ start:9282 stop:9620 length:339 start_codon:yes stop_codon:yes gene_type:complete
MARNWFNSNRGQGNVLRTNGEEITATATITPNANIHVVKLTMALAATLTGAAASAVIGDIVSLVISNPTGGPLDVTLAGDFKAGTITVATTGVASVLLIFNGTDYAATETPV